MLPHPATTLSSEKHAKRAATSQSWALCWALSILQGKPWRLRLGRRWLLTGSNSRDSEEQRSESARRIWRQQGGSRTAAENRTVGDDAEYGWARRPRMLNVRYIAKPSPRSYREPREEDTRTL